ncbi:MAG: ABC transporter permease [Catenulispora sp.]|nr:ABC transporter permease [Catenulispora sp.]
MTTTTLATPTAGPGAPVGLPKTQSSALGHALADSRVLLGRNLKHLLRNPEQFFQAVSLPMILTLLFRYLLGGAFTGGGQAYIDYVLPGLMAISMGFNSTTTVVGVTNDMRSGLVERFRSMPATTPAVLIAHVSAAVLRNMLSLVVMIGVGLAVGFRPHAGVGGWLAAIGFLLLFNITLSWIAALLGVAATTVEGATGLSMILVFVPYLTSAMVPTSTMPAGLRAVVDNQPFTPLIDAVRKLLADAPLGNSVWVALLWWLGILAVTVPYTLRVFERRARKRR